jgi:hypothetical protein
MKKPSWKYAPFWAKWLAMDADGVWCWYEFKPDAISKKWDISEDGGVYAVASDECSDWANTLEPRQ